MERTRHPVIQSQSYLIKWYYTINALHLSVECLKKQPSYQHDEMPTRVLQMKSSQESRALKYYILQWKSTRNKMMLTCENQYRYRTGKHEKPPEYSQLKDLNHDFFFHLPLYSIIKVCHDEYCSTRHQTIKKKVFPFRKLYLLKIHHWKNSIGSRNRQKPKETIEKVECKRMVPNGNS